MQAAFKIQPVESHGIGQPVLSFLACGPPPDPLEVQVRVIHNGYCNAFLAALLGNVSAVVISPAAPNKGIRWLPQPIIQGRHYFWKRRSQIDHFLGASRQISTEVTEPGKPGCPLQK